MEKSELEGLVKELRMLVRDMATMLSLLSDEALQELHEHWGECPYSNIVETARTTIDRVNRALKP